MKKIIIGYDTNGTVHDQGSNIVRKIRQSYLESAKEIFGFYSKLGLDKIGVVKTSFEEQSATFLHEKHTISYPFEWTASMYKDAVLLHLDLFLELDKHGLTFKDALPNNIVFDNTNPIFVDFLSLVKTKNLSDEKWLAEGFAGSDFRFAVLDKMFFPFMLLPFIAFAQKKQDLARSLLLDKACNCGGGTPSYKDLAIDDKALGGCDLIRCIKNLFRRKKKRKNSSTTPEINALIALMSQKNKGNFADFCQKIKNAVQSIDARPDRSGYDSYYENKTEKLNFSDQSDWKNKQKVVFNALKKHEPKTVLDLGANTGWFSMLAENLGAKVNAVEIDESCVDLLYLEAKKKNLNILPLKISFQDLEKEKFGEVFNDEVYKDRDFVTNPLFLAPVNRLQSDLVLCLALTHHLILGAGMSIEDVMQKLSKLSKKTLVLEHTEINDPLIVEEPTFFGNIRKFSQQNYNIDLVIAEGMKHFKEVEVFDSHPSTRKIIIFNK